MAADTFTANSANSSGSAAGDYAWSNAANWSPGIPDQNAQASIAATNETLLIDGADAANQISFGYSTYNTGLSVLILAGDSLTIGAAGASGDGASVTGGTTLTIAAASAGSLTISGGSFEVKNTATLNMLGGSFVDQTSGGLTLDTGATATFAAGVGFSVKTITLTGTANLSLASGSQSAPDVVGSVNGTAGSSKLTETGGDLQIAIGGGGTYSVGGGGAIEFTTGLSSAAIDLTGGLVQLDNNVSLQSGTSFVFSGSTASTLDVVSSSNYQNGFSYTVSGFDHGDTLEFGTTTLSSYVYTASNHTLSLTNASGTTFKLTNLSFASDVAAQPNFKLSGNTVQLACFLTGTMIETADGPVPVQDLRVGASVITIENGRRVPRPARWIGSKRIHAARFADKADAYPVRIRAGAIAPHMPRRDLLVTGEHGIHIGAGLIPARMLVNGRSIVRDTGIAHYRVYHVEFDSHAIMLAEGLETESYLDTGNRASFDGACESAAPRSWSTDAAAPLTTARETVEPIWRALDRRADTLGLAPACGPLLSDDPELELLLEDGRLLRPRWERQGRHFFHVPCGARPSRLLSHAARPSESIGSFVDDRRLLGVAVRGITHWDGLHDRVLQAADLTGDGWHGLETSIVGCCRWTDGHAALPIQAALGDDCFLEIQVAAVMHYPRQHAERLAA